MNKKFFSCSIADDKELFASIEKELLRQQNQIELIASENIVSKAVLEAAGTILTNKYAEGYPSKRYYGGCVYVDEVENIAIERAKKLFNCNYANVQPHSGSSANLAVYFGLLMPGDTILGMDISSGGHLTHGARVSFSGKWFNSVSYSVNKDSMLIDYNEIEEKALLHKPKMIIAGYSAYSRQIDFKRFREIADKVGAYLLVDMAHFAGLVATGYHDSPFDYAHVVTTTTHKTLRGPRGGLILTNHEDIIKKINSAVFPATQGGPLMHIIAAKAVAFKEALEPEFKYYIENVLKNAKVLSSVLTSSGLNVLTGGTDNHLVLIDLRPYNITGLDAEHALERAGFTCNKNGIPFDKEKPTITSGIRLGSPAATSRGFLEKEFEFIGSSISKVLQGLKNNGVDGNKKLEMQVYDEVKELCSKFPIYPNGVK